MLRSLELDCSIPLSLFQNNPRLSRFIFTTLLKAPRAVVFVILLTLPACSSNWVIKPLSDYLKKKTGLEMTAERVTLGINPLHLEGSGIQLNYKKGPDSWEAKIPDLRVILGWTLSWEDLPWPKIYIKKIWLNQPKLMVRQPKAAKGADWTTWLKIGPVINELEMNNLQGRLELGSDTFHLAPGSRISASYSPDQGGKVDYHLKRFQGNWSSKQVNFQTRSEGSIEWSWQEDTPRWKGTVSFSQADISWKKGKISDSSGTITFLLGPSVKEISTSSSTLKEITWNEPNLTFQGRGNVRLSGALHIKKEPFLSDLSVQAENLDWAIRQKDRWIRGRTEGLVHLSGPFFKPILKGKLAIRESAFQLPPVSTQGMDGEVVFQGRFPALSFPLVKAKAERTDWHIGENGLLIIRPEARLATHLGGKMGHVDLKDIRLTTENWGTLRGDLHFNPTLGSAPSGKVQAEKFPLTQFLNLFYPQDRKPFSENIVCQGTAEWSRDKADAPLGFLLSLSPAPFSFKRPGSAWEGEGLKTRIDLQGKWYLGIKKVDWQVKQSIFGGAILRSPWMFNFDQHHLKIQGLGTLEAAGPTGLLKGSLDLTADPLGQWRVFGEYPFRSSPRTFSGSLEIRDLPTEKAYPLLFGGPLSSSHPFLGKPSLQGLLNARLTVSKKVEALQIDGHLAGSHMALHFREPALSFNDLTLDLPFNLTTARKDAESSLYTKSGFIRIKSVKGPDLDETGWSIPLLVKTNQFEITEPIKIPLAGGSLSLTDFTFRDPLGKFRIATTLSLKDLKLNRLMTLQGISGSVKGRLDPLIITKEKVQTTGTLEAAIWGGTVGGKNISVTDPFTQDRRFQGTLFFNHLNLEAITNLFSFGKITGFVQGELTGLSFRHNRPESFHLIIKTQDVPGTDKTIHIKAIENISLLGTGWGELDVLRKGINSWITEYDYKEIGVACSLKEDQFRIKGTIQEDGLEYLVRRPNLFGIDIINKNPDNEISFSDIMERMQRIKENSQEGNRR